MSGKKILYLCDYPMDLIGGAEKSTATMAKAMAANGYEVAILAENSLNKDTAFDNIRLYQFKNRQINTFRFYRKHIMLLNI